MSETHGKGMAECARHGRREATLVCQHLAASLSTRVPVGFFWAGSSTRKRPDAWCIECNNRFQLTNWQWVGPVLEHFGAKVLCAGCYDDLRELNLSKKPAVPQRPTGE